MKRFKSKRGLVAGLLFASVIVGLVVHTGTGTPSALGWRDIAVLCPVGALEVFAGAKSFLVHPAVLFAAVCVLAFLFGRSFCAWGCPVPHIRDFFRPQKKSAQSKGRAHERQTAHSEGDTDLDAAATILSAEVPNCAHSFTKDGSDDSAAPQEKSAASSKGRLAPVGGERDGRVLDSRHFVLAGAVASSFAFGFPVFCLVCPVGLSFAVAIGVWNLFRFNETSWGLIIFPVLILIEVVFFRKWCAKLCPIGALASLVASGRGLCRPRVNEDVCLRDKGVNCTHCVDVCEEKLDPHTGSIPECTRCGACLEGCPAQAISMKLMAKHAGEKEAVRSAKVR